MGRFSKFFHPERNFLDNLDDMENVSQFYGTATYCINPHSFVCQLEDKKYFEAMSSCTYLLPDGVGYVLGVRLAFAKKLARITGLDFYQRLMKILDREGASVAFLGGDEATLVQIKRNISGDCRKVSLFTYSPPFKDEFSDADIHEMMEFLNNCKPDFVWVGLTAPKQEKLIYELRWSFPKVGWGAIGAVFDYVAFPQKKRPPELIRFCGFEWLYRLVQNPRKMWRRTVISLPKFLGILIFEKFSN